MSAYVNKYSYRPGFAFKVPAQIVGETLNEIAGTGTVTSQTFLDVSRPETAPTHNLFEWNDEIAAERYRLQQATIVINAIEIEIENTSETKQSQVAFVNIVKKAPHRSGSFVPINIALSDQDMRSVVLANAMNELESFRRKYQNLNELASVFKAIDDIENQED